MQFFAQDQSLEEVVQVGFVEAEFFEVNGGFINSACKALCGVRGSCGEGCWGGTRSGSCRRFKCGCGGCSRFERGCRLRCCPFGRGALYRLRCGCGSRINCRRGESRFCRFEGGSEEFEQGRRLRRREEGGRCCRRCGCTVREVSKLAFDAGIDLFFTGGDSTLCCFKADDLFADHFIQHRLPDEFGQAQLGFDALELRSHIHTEELLVLLELDVVIDQLLAAQFYTRFEFFDEDLFVVHFCHGAAELQDVDVEPTVEEKQDDRAKNAEECV